MTDQVKQLISRPRPKLAVLCRLAFITTCVFFFMFALSGNHPPANAQQPPYGYYPHPATIGDLQVASATQEVSILGVVRDQANAKVDLDRYEKDTSKRLDSMAADIKANTDAASTMRGMMQAGGFVLVALQIGSMVWGRRKAA